MRNVDDAGSGGGTSCHLKPSKRIYRRALAVPIYPLLPTHPGSYEAVELRDALSEASNLSKLPIFRDFVRA